MSYADWRDLCPQTIIYQAMTGRDHYGKPTYGAAQNFQGRRVFKAERVAAYERGTKGQGPEVISASQVWILGVPQVGAGGGYEDRCYVNGDTIFPPILSVNRWPDENGDEFTKVMMGSANG